MNAIASGAPAFARRCFCSRVLLFLQSEAVRTRSREIELGRNMHVWLGTMGLSIGGTTYRLVSEQARKYPDAG